MILEQEVSDSIPGSGKALSSTRVGVLVLAYGKRVLKKKAPILDGRFFFRDIKDPVEYLLVFFIQVGA